MADLSTRLPAHLEEERQAITSGAMSALRDLGAAKIALFAQMEENPPSTDALALIGRRAARNMRLLDAALRGVKEAAERLRALREVQAGFGTYGAGGQKRAHETGRPAFEHKA